MSILRAARQNASCQALGFPEQCVLSKRSYALMDLVQGCDSIDRLSGHVWRAGEWHPIDAVIGGDAT